MQCKHHADMRFVYTTSISPQTALLPSTRRLAAHILHALTIHRREIQTLWSHNHDAGSYETLYDADSSSGDVVIYWTMSGTHVVPDRQQYDEHTPTTYYKTLTTYASSRYDTWRKYFKPLFQVFFDFQHTQRSRWLFILERYKLYDHITTTHAAMIRCTK